MAQTPQWALEKIQAAKNKHLLKLDLSGWQKDKLTEIPSEVFALTWLDELSLSDNQIRTIPDAISELHNLYTLNLNRNQITTIPDAISQLDNLYILNLSGNKIRTIPDAIAQLHNLFILDLHFNQITKIPDAVAQLHNLSKLDLNGNQIRTIPDAIAQLHNLSELYLSENQITKIPDAIAQLHNLSTLYLTQNPIENLPLEVVAKGIKGIREYFRQIKEQGRDYLYEAKLLIVGEGGAGKTTLAKKIQNPDYELQKEDSTQGIEVVKWRFIDNQRNFQVNIWDFGGQEIYHETHQFFLTKRSLYIVVADNREENTDFYHWLNIVSLLSDNSPVLIINNEKENRKRQINESQLRGEFNNLEDSLGINLAKAKKDGFDFTKILNEIQHQIITLPHIGTELPKTWVKVRESLENDNRNYITLEEYLNICQENGFKEKKDKLQLSGYLHDLGVILHFQDDPLLNKTVILKPNWGTNAVYKVLDNGQVIDNFGRFTKSDLENIWDNEIYADKQDELLQLMINFQLCYQIPGNKNSYIAPQLLSIQKPAYKWNENNNLILRYTYEFMPKGIITRLIVILNKWIDKEKLKDLVWKKGVVFRNNETRVEVIEFYNKREIKIRVMGGDKRDLLTKITHEIDKIHDSYSRLKYSKLIPCNCQSCEDTQNPNFYDFQELKERLRNGKYDIECKKPPYYQVDIRGLIDDVIVERMIENESLEFRRDERYNSRDSPVAVHFHVNNNPVNQVSQELNSKPENMTKPSNNNKNSDLEEQVKLPFAFRNGMFYLFIFVVVFSLIAFFGGSLEFHYLVLAIIGTAIFIVLIGVLQLRQDERLSEKSFVDLIKLVIAQLPLIGNLRGRKK